MRKTKNVTIMEDGQEIKFHIKQMSATQLESWIIRALLLAGGSGLAVPEGADIQAAGAYLAGRGFGALGGLEYSKIEPLMNDLLACCYHITGDNSMTQLNPGVVDGIIGDVRTLFELRKEALALNLGFLGPEGVSLSGFQEKANTAQQ